MTQRDSIPPRLPNAGAATGPSGRAPGATLARLHRAHRGAFELITIALVGILSGMAFAGNEPLRFAVVGAVAGVATAIAFMLAAELRWDITQTSMHTARQVEALRWVKERLHLDRLQLPERGYAANPDFLSELVRIVDQHKPSLVLELGSGVSTVVLAARLRGEGRVVSLDHEREYAQQTRDQLVYHDLEATVIDAPLAPVQIAGRAWEWYSLPDGLTGVDMLVVDGPPGHTGPLARYPALPLLRPLLSPGAVICVDDGARADEREMVRMWLAEQPELSWRYIPTEAGMYELTLLPARRPDAAAG